MARRYTMTADYPLAGADDGLPVVITFDRSPGRLARWYLHNGDPGYPAEPQEVSLYEVAPTEGEVPIRIQQAIWCWACDWLESDEGRAQALDIVADAEDRAREFAAELRRDA